MKRSERNQTKGHGQGRPFLFNQWLFLVVFWLFIAKWEENNNIPKKMMIKQYKRNIMEKRNKHSRHKKNKQHKRHRR